ncbi:MAG: AMP-binding protein [Burkholderiales bacterium]|nr:AMP-binding protein [Burkholderiales bacterium]
MPSESLPLPPASADASVRTFAPSPSHDVNTDEYSQYDSYAQDHLPARQKWPHLLFDLPHLHYPHQLNCVEELLGAAALARFGDRIAIRSPRHCWSYREFAQQVDAIALALLQDAHVRPGMRVLLRAANTPEAAACLLAIIKIGAIAVPTMPMLRARELSAILLKSKAELAICGSDLLEELEMARQISDASQTRLWLLDTGAAASNHVSAQLNAQANEQPNELPSVLACAARKHGACPAYASRADTICLLAFTSGTTGRPKATVHFHRDLLTISDCFPRSHLRLQADDVMIGTPALAFTFGLGGLLFFPLRYGAATVLQSYASAEDLWQAIAHYQATICFSAPTFYRKMALSSAREVQPASLRYAVCAGEALSPTTRQLWQTKVGLIDGLGSTEMLHIFVSAAGEDVREGAIGRAIPGYQVAILDHHGQPCALGTRGRLAVRGPTGCRYLDDERMAEYVQGGWNITGDTCSMDEDGYVYYHGRNDDMIISSGYNIAPCEVEEVLLQHPAVQECAVLGAPDSERGQIVQAFVVLHPGIAASNALQDDLQDFMKTELAPYKYPRQIHFLRSLPRTSSGKLQRFALRDAALA